MTDPLRLPTGPTTILDIPLPDQGFWSQPSALERTDPGPEIPEPIPPQYLESDMTTLLQLPPTFDWTHSEQVGYQLQVRMTDLEAWLQLREKYGTPNNLIALINSDRVMLGQSGSPFPYVSEF